jgi:Lysylphosphatidylglycerol synthase TM region
MRKSHLVVAFLGVVLFIWVIAHMGLSANVRDLRAVRVALPLVLLMSLFRLLLQTTAWSQALKDQTISVPAGTLIGTRLVSQGMGYLTVLGPVLSEPMKIKLLRAPAEPTVTATFLDDGVYWFTTTLIAIAGWLFLPLVAVHGIHVVPAAFAALGLTMILFFIARQKPVLFALVRRLGKRAPHWLVRAAILESSIRNYRGRRPTLVRRMFWMGLGCQLLIAAEVVVILWALHLPIHFLPVLAIEGVTRGLKMVSGWIPARLGSDEEGAISAFALTGFSPALGLALALTRRFRDLLWALIGLSWLVWKSRKMTDRQNAVEHAPRTFLKEAA